MSCRQVVVCTAVYRELRRGDSFGFGRCVCTCLRICEDSRRDADVYFDIVFDEDCGLRERFSLSKEFGPSLPLDLKTRRKP